MGRFVDLTGKKYNMLTVIEREGTGNGGDVRWLCVCDCGKQTVVLANNLKRGEVKSCGCLKKISPSTTHNKSKTRLYTIWINIKTRCKNEKNKFYPQYGGRGIKICNEWDLDFMKFHDWAMANGYEEHLTIDRIDVNGNYEPSNCRWITLKEQENNKTKHAMITYCGKTQNISQWSDELGIPYKTLWTRLKVRKWSVERAFSKTQK